MGVGWWGGEVGGVFWGGGCWCWGCGWVGGGGCSVKLQTWMTTFLLPVSAAGPPQPYPHLNLILHLSPTCADMDDDDDGLDEDDEDEEQAVSACPA